MSVKEWGESHRREARARLYQLAASAVLDGVDWANAGDVANSNGAISERHFRDTLRVYADFDAARISREVRRVRDLAEGRKVRETFWKWTFGGVTFTNADEKQARRFASREGKGARVIRVTRVRKA